MGVRSALLREEPRLPGARVLELVTELGYEGSRTRVYDHLREIRPLFLPSRTFQRTAYRRGEILQFDLLHLAHEVPVGHGQTRKGYLVAAALGYSRAGAGTLIFSREAVDILATMTPPERGGRTTYCWPVGLASWSSRGCCVGEGPMASHGGFSYAMLRRLRRTDPQAGAAAVSDAVHAVLLACDGRPLPVDTELIAVAAQLSLDYNLTAYDAAYVAAAHRHGCALVSVDIADLVSRELAVTPDSITPVA